METEIAALVTQFGVAGLIGWMWLSERRSAMSRERRLDEAHRMLMAERRDADALLRALADNTRALAAIESGQRELTMLLAGVFERRRPE